MQLFYLAVDSYKMLSSSKDMVKHGDVIFKTYLDHESVSVCDGVHFMYLAIISALNR